MKLQLIIIFAELCLLKAVLVMIFFTRDRHESASFGRPLEQELDPMVKLGAFRGLSAPHSLLKRGAPLDDVDELLLPGGLLFGRDDLGLGVYDNSSGTTIANAKHDLMDPDFFITLHREGYYTVSGEQLYGRDVNVTKNIDQMTMSPAPVSADVAFERGYCLGTHHHPPMFNWLCKGPRMDKVPIGLPNVISLSALVIYKDTLRDFSMEHSLALHRIEPGAFNRMGKLRVIYILDAPLLTSFDRALNGSYPDLQIIRIELTGLRTWPDLGLFRRDNKTFTSLDLDFNEIATLGEEPLNISTESLNLDHNQIRYIHEHTFGGSEIGELSLKGNRQLAAIHELAFASTRNLMKLDLSDTAIASLPTAGLDELRLLILVGTQQLLKMPSIYGFPKLETALLHYSYHCCSFRYHKLHDPRAYHEFQLLQMETNRLCPQARLPAAAATNVSLNPGGLPGLQSNDTSSNPEFEGIWLGELVAGANQNNGSQQQQQPTRGANKSLVATSSAGLKLLNKLLIGNVECGELAQLATVPNVTCSPHPDAFNPCEDIMGYRVLRIAVWLVAAASIIGNLSVIVVLSSVYQRLSVPKFLQLNLAVGDLFMGIYLAMLALADVSTVGSYFNYALGWQHGYGCMIAGAASLFASQLSIYTLTVITFERYYTITYSIDLNMRLQLRPAVRIMAVGWLFAFASAMLPIFCDVSSYSKTSICLPLRMSSMQDQIFLYLLLFLDSCAFVVIFGCYLKMYLLITSQKSQATMRERTIAFRMAVLVMTNFACWFPIIFFGATALSGAPLISVTDSKILIVFFYPLNSMANPYLYVISTRQYRRDLSYLSSRWQTWRRNLFRFGAQLDSPAYYNQTQLQVMLNQAPTTAICLANAAAQSGPGRCLRPAHLNRQLRLAQQQRQKQRHQQRVLVCSQLSHQSGRYLIGHEVQPVVSTELVELASTLVVHQPDSRAPAASSSGQPTKRPEPVKPAELPAPRAHTRSRAVCCCCSRQASMSPGQLDDTQEQRLTVGDSSGGAGPIQVPPVQLQTLLGASSGPPQPRASQADKPSVKAADTRNKIQKKSEPKRRCSCLAVDDIFVDSLRDFQHQLNLPKPEPCLKHPRHHRANTIGADTREVLRPRQPLNEQVDILGNLIHSSHKIDSSNGPDDAREQPRRCQKCDRQLVVCSSSTGCQHRGRRHHHHHQHHHRHQHRHHHHHHHHHQHHRRKPNGDLSAQDAAIDTSTSGNQSPGSCHHLHRSQCRRLNQPELLPAVKAASSADEKQGRQQDFPLPVDGNRPRLREKCCPTRECSAPYNGAEASRQLKGPPVVVIHMGPDRDDVGQPAAKGPSTPDSPNNSQSNDLKLGPDRLKPVNHDHRHRHHHRRHHRRRSLPKHKHHEAHLAKALAEKQQEAGDDQLQPDAISQMVVLVSPPESTNTVSGNGRINRKLTSILKRQSTVPKESETRVARLVKTGSLELLSSARRTIKGKKRVSIVTTDAEIIASSDWNKAI